MSVLGKYEEEIRQGNDGEEGVSFGHDQRGETIIMVLPVEFSAVMETE